MTNAEKEQILSLASHIVFDHGIALRGDDAFKSYMQAIDKITNGCLSACKTLLTAKLLLKEHNSQENKAHD